MTGEIGSHGNRLDGNWLIGNGSSSRSNQVDNMVPMEIRHIKTYATLMEVVLHEADLGLVSMFL